MGRSAGQSQPVGQKTAGRFLARRSAGKPLRWPGRGGGPASGRKSTRSTTG